MLFFRFILIAICWTDIIDQAFTALTLAAESGVGCPSINVVPALESELEPFSKLQAFSLNDMLNIDVVSHVPIFLLLFLVLFSRETEDGKITW